MAGEMIGVLLPVRLETKFIDPATPGGAWRLNVAVIPDEASMNRHSPTASDGELDRLEAAWRACRGDLASEEGRSAFFTLAGEVGAARAHWLLRAFPPQVDEAGEADWNAAHVIDWQAAQALRRAPDDSVLSRIDGLPDQIEIWLGIEENNVVRLEQLQPPLAVQHDRLIFDDQMRLFSEELWWIKDAGLAGTRDLPFTTREQLHSIAYIIAVGLGDGRPEPLFQAHRDAGSFSLLPLGRPTNTISGEPAVDLARDAETWWRLATAPVSSPQVENLALALNGRADALHPLPGAVNEDPNLDAYLSGSLWSALWGHTLRDIWGVDRDMGPGFSARLGGWSGGLAPEGPLPPVRLGDQAYGVLPASSLSGWRPTLNSTPIDELAPILANWRDEWARLAEEGSGAAAGKETEVLLDLLARVPNSSAYAYRRFAPLQVLLALASAMGYQADPPHIRDEWENRSGGPASSLLPTNPIRRYATFGWSQNSHLPLVEPPEPLAAAEAEVVDAGGSLFFDWLRFIFDLCMDNEDVGVTPLCYPGEHRRPSPPNSLLLRLLLYSGALAHADLIQFIDGREGPLIDPLIQDESRLCRLLATSFDGRWLTFRQVLEAEGAVGNVAGSPQHELCVWWIEAVRGLLDLYDNALNEGPQSVQDLLAAIERVFRATLDTALMRVDPWITSLATKRLRELRQAGAPDGLGVYGWVDKPYTGNPGPTAGGIIHAPSEAQLRAAVVLRDKAISDPDSTRWQIALDSRQVRLAEQLAAEVRAGSPLPEVLGRMVEQIIGDPATIERLRQDPDLWMRREHAGRRVIDGQKALARGTGFFAGLGLDEETQLAPIAELDTALDAYADLLVAGAVYNVTSGRPEKAGELMEAAPGLGIPPPLDLLRTPRQGRAASTRVLLVLRDEQASPDLEPGASPAALADAAVAAYLNRRWPAAQRLFMTAAGPIRLDKLGLQPADTLSLSEDTLRRLVESEAGALLVEDETQSPGIAMHRRIKRLARLLAAECWQDQAPELRARYRRLYSAALLMRDALQARQPGSLIHARRWGIAPPAGGQDDEELAAQFDSALATLSERIAAAPLPDAPADDTPAQIGAAFTEDTPAHQIAAALSQLASPGGGLPIYGRMLRSQIDGLLPQYTQPEAQRFTILKPNPSFDRAWLEVVAAVRPNLARLESWQLEGGAQHFQAWTNQNDPWVLQPLSEEARVSRTSQLVVAYGPPGVIRAKPDRLLAVAELDAWAETVPDEHHATAAAFGFNAPAAQAPQALLIAVPPDLDHPLDGSMLAEIVRETRALAHARMAVPADIAPYAGVFPFTMLPVRDAGGVSFDLTEAE